MGERSTALETYVRPILLATYSIEELRAEAAIVMTYSISDRTLKQDIEGIEQPLDQLGKIKTS
jgi:hypothetical protein